MLMRNNRYGAEYSFVSAEDNLYRFNIAESEMEYMRMGGREEAEIDMEDLGFFDPSGGPFVEVGSKIYEGCNALTVTRIMSRADGLFVEAE
jgi:hypothetical protein